MIDRTYDSYSREELIRLLRDRDRDEAGGLRLQYAGQTPPWRIVRRVQPRVQRIADKLGCGSEVERTNIILEGENLQGMVSLYQYRGQVTSFSPTRPITPARTFVTTTAGTKTPTTLTSVRSCPWKTVRGIPSGSGSWRPGSG